MHVSVFMDHVHVITQDKYRGLYVNASYAHTVVLTILVVLYKRYMHVTSLLCRVLGTWNCQIGERSISAYSKIRHAFHLLFAV